jgi:SAM-dependent methyltransferase
MTLIFDTIAETYDQWFDSPEGRAIYETELTCLRSLCAQCQGRWLEAGVGTGRFASRMGITEGVDPSPRMLEIAAGRGIRTYEGYAEELPFPDSTFDGVLIALALCFIPNPEKALKECHRVLRDQGNLLLGDIPDDSPWGRAYEREKVRGDPVWSRASFLPASELAALIEKAGFRLQKAASTLFWEPTDSPELEPRLETGIISNAGFLGLLFTKINQ